MDDSFRDQIREERLEMMRLQKEHKRLRAADQHKDADDVMAQIMQRKKRLNDLHMDKAKEEGGDVKTASTATATATSSKDYHKVHPLAKKKPHLHQQQQQEKEEAVSESSRLQWEEAMNAKHMIVLQERVQGLKNKIPNFSDSVWGRGVGVDVEGERRVAYDAQKQRIEQRLQTYLEMEIQVMNNRLEQSKEFEKMRGISDKEQRQALLAEVKALAAAKRAGDLKLVEDARATKVEVEKDIESMRGEGPSAAGAGSEL